MVMEGFLHHLPGRDFWHISFYPFGEDHVLFLLSRISIPKSIWDRVKLLFGAFKRYPEKKVKKGKKAIC